VDSTARSFLSVSYKKDIDDLRESPALTIIDLLQEQGATVSYNDPFFPLLDKGRKYNLQPGASLWKRLAPMTVC
jgi:UDP-N-acetyl-D-mannosaminuronate dehydrogenase